MSFLNRTHCWAPLSLLLTVFACSDDSPLTAADAGAASTPTDARDATAVSDARPVDTTDATSITATPVSLRFEGRVGARLFECGTTYPDVGLSHATATAGDLRFFVHSIRFSKSGGSEASLSVDERAPWQGMHVGLLDFENKTGECTFGTSATNDVVTGSLPPGDFDTIAFEIGVPEELNHINVETAGAPFTASKLQWDWSNGFIHFAAQLNSQATFESDAGAATRVPSFFAHLGSTECSPMDAGVASCARKNRPSVRLTNFDAVRDKIVVDVAQLLADSNVDENTPNTIPGCMSGPTDPECDAVFRQLGLDFASGAPSMTAVQSALSVEAR